MYFTGKMLKRQKKVGGEEYLAGKLFGLPVVAFWGKKEHKDTLYVTLDHKKIVHLAEKARREGILGLEKDVQEFDDPFFKKALQLVIDGTEVTSLREILARQFRKLSPRHDAMPFRPLFLLPALPRPALARGQAKIRDRTTSLGITNLGIRP